MEGICSSSLLLLQVLQASRRITRPAKVHALYGWRTATEKPIRIILSGICVGESTFFLHFMYVVYRDEGYTNASVCGGVCSVIPLRGCQGIKFRFLGLAVSVFIC